MNLTKRLQKAVSITALCVVIAVSLAYVFELSKLGASYRDVAASVQIKSTERLALVIDNEIKTATNVLWAIAKTGEVLDYKGSVENCNKTLLEIKDASEKRFVNISRIDANGVFVCSSSGDLTIGLKASDFGTYLQELLANPDYAPVISPVIVPSIGNPNGPVLAIHVPVYRDGIFDGTVGGAFSIDVFKGGLLEGLIGDDDAIITILEEGGEVVMSTFNSIDRRNVYTGIPFDVLSADDQDNLKKIANSIFILKPGVETFSLAGKEYIHSYTHTELTPQRYWGVIISAATDGALVTRMNRVFDKISYEFFAIVIAVLFLAGLLFYLYTKYQILGFYDKVIAVLNLIKLGEIENLREYLIQNKLDFVSEETLNISMLNKDKKAASTSSALDALTQVSDLNVLSVDRNSSVLGNVLGNFSDLIQGSNVSFSDFAKKFKNKEKADELLKGNFTETVLLESLGGRWYEITSFIREVKGSGVETYLIIKDRTSQVEQGELLEQKTQELQRLNKAMIAREVRISELKEKKKEDDNVK